MQEEQSIIPNKEGSLLPQRLQVQEKKFRVMDGSGVKRPAVRHD
ncbi:hypothetical protein [Virgibacillus sediminis]|uniref:Uncharacterized protein n=1 Tax=Virgibacillus sediminis TaxID=202260 RepID=A0ABV7A2L2_9BACI